MSIATKAGSRTATIPHATRNATAKSIAVGDGANDSPRNRELNTSAPTSDNARSSVPAAMSHPESDANTAKNVEATTPIAKTRLGTISVQYFRGMSMSPVNGCVYA